MDRIFKFEVFEQRCRWVAIAIKLVEANRHHIGIAYSHPDNSGSRFLHLAWHRDLRNETVRPEYLYADPDLPSDDTKQISALCCRIAKGSGRDISYGFSMFSDSFGADTGSFLSGGRLVGLTCASFVLGVFDAIVGPLVDLDSWPTRPEDAEWQNWVVSIIRSQGAPASEVDAMASQVGFVRVRPAEVAAASITGQFPATFRAIEPVCRQLSALL